MNEVRNERNELNAPTGYAFRICGSGIYQHHQPRYATAKDAHDDLWRYARSVDQSPLLFTVYEDKPDGSYVLA